MTREIEGRKSGLICSTSEIYIMTSEFKIGQVDFYVGLVKFPP